MRNKLQSQDLKDVVGVLLAGGSSRRFGGGDKCLRTLSAQSLLGRVADRAKPQVGSLILNASGAPDRFDGYGLEVVADSVEGGHGPLAGILTGLEWAEAHVPHSAWLASFATDAPFVPLDMVARLFEAVAQQPSAQIALATSGGRVHPVFALWRVDLAPDLRQAVAVEGLRKVMTWVERYNSVHVDFSDAHIDPFFNINSELDLAEAERLILKVQSR